MDIGCSLEFLPEAMDNREKWWEKVSDFMQSTWLDNNDDDRIYIYMYIYEYTQWVICVMCVNQNLDVSCVNGFYFLPILFNLLFLTNIINLCLRFLPPVTRLYFFAFLFAYKSPLDTHPFQANYWSAIVKFPCLYLIFVIFSVIKNLNLTRNYK